MKKFLKISSLAILTLFAFNSCGDGKQNENTNDQHVIQEETVEVADDVATAVNNLTIDSNDQMKFTKSELRATAGSITLTLNHVGQMPKEAMGHNLVILKPGTDIADFSVKAVGAKDTNYIPESEKGNVIAFTKVLSGGESDTIEFTITEKGTYDFICSFPGHSSMMKGKLIVE